jgi:hypothetical protein
VARGIEVERALDRHEDVQARLARGLHDRLQRHRLQQLAQVEGDFLSLLEGERVELGLVARLLLARVDVGIDVEHDPVGVVEDRILEGRERARVVRALRDAVGSRLRARVPHVEFQRARLREPEERGQVVAEKIVVLLVLAAREDRDRLDEIGLLLVPMLLEEALPVDARGHADHRERTIGEVRQDARRHLREIAQQVALGERRLLQRRIRGPVDAIQVRDLDLVPLDEKREVLLRRVELLDDVVPTTLVVPA